MGHQPGQQGFLVIRPSGSTDTAGGPHKINIVLNFFEEMKWRAPVK